MVAELWTGKMRSQVATAATMKKEHSKPPPDPDGFARKENCIGILSFEVAGAMSKAAHLHRSLSTAEVSRLCSEVLKSHALRALVSTDEARLLDLVIAEKLDDLTRVAAVVSRLGKKRCTEPALEKYVRSTASLYGELEVLSELEQAAKKLQQLGRQHEETRRAYEQKIQWQKHDVKQLRDASLWNQTYDKIVGLMARAVCTIHARLRLVFGESAVLVPGSDSSPEVSRQLSGHIASSRRRLPPSGPIVPATKRSQPGTLRRESPGFPCGSSPAKLLTECLSITSSAALKDDDGADDHFQSEGCLSRAGGTSVPSSGDPRRPRRASPFAPKNGVAMQAAPSTVGGSALALHYANVVIIVEKLLRYPHLVGEDARDDLYQMLPASLRSTLRGSLRSYAKDLAIYDAPLAHDWKERLEKTLNWLAPMAHNMIRWQTERNFEQQQIGVRANVLLLQTLYFADREKTEAAMCELLVGLNYICRYEHQQSALLDCASSLDFDDECMDWQLQF